MSGPLSILKRMTQKRGGWGGEHPSPPISYIDMHCTFKVGTKEGDGKSSKRKPHTLLERDDFLLMMVCAKHTPVSMYLTVYSSPYFGFYF